MTHPPHRDPDKLRESWNKHGTVVGVAEDLGCNHTTAAKWLDRHGIRSKNEPTLAQLVQNGALDGDELEEGFQ